ncbi:hypothetical protein QCD61_28435 (plasmid) [Pseudomonas viciae]|uniref:Uncharacterized protein n=1 Tax=Pseudomonas viciae TaxID=2505979 RepID=A0ABY8PMI5_9PSED|nr:hypothetical protein [Pseudomonas viciae]WGO96428.1 hypothetical protein QCD61_28435 [Pseudomonas viciae]
MKRLMTYTTPLNLKLYLASYAVIVASFVLASAAGSNLVLALGLSAAALMWWPMVRDLGPVAWSVVIQGRWPTRNT